jgi:hypothetical protein
MPRRKMPPLPFDYSALVAPAPQKSESDSRTVELVVKAVPQSTRLTLVAIRDLTDSSALKSPAISDKGGCPKWNVTIPTNRAVCDEIVSNL